MKFKWKFNIITGIILNLSASVPAHVTEETDQTEQDHDTDRGDLQSVQPVDLVVKHSDLLSTLSHGVCRGHRHLGQGVASQHYDEDDKHGDGESKRDDLGNLVSVHF